MGSHLRPGGENRRTVGHLKLQAHNCNGTGASRQRHSCQLSVHDVGTSLVAIRGTSTGCEAKEISPGVGN